MTELFDIAARRQHPARADPRRCGVRAPQRARDRRHGDVVPRPRADQGRTMGDDLGLSLHWTEPGWAHRGRWKESISGAACPQAVGVDSGPCPRVGDGAAADAGGGATITGRILLGCGEWGRGWAEPVGAPARPAGLGTTWGRLSLDPWPRRGCRARLGRGRTGWWGSSLAAVGSAWGLAGRLGQWRRRWRETRSPTGMCWAGRSA
jgi:hypothetical protein